MRPQTTDSEFQQNPFVDPEVILETLIQFIEENKENIIYNLDNIIKEFLNQASIIIIPDQ